MKNILIKSIGLALVLFIPGLPAYAADITVAEPWVR